MTECGREDSNLHPRKDQDLNLARMPISPRPRSFILGQVEVLAWLLHVARTGSLKGMSSLMNPFAMAAASGAEGASLNERLLKERIVFLGSQVDQNSANTICAQLLLLEAEDPTKDISLYINSPGGSVIDGLAIYDTMQYVQCDVRTIAVGMAASMGQFLLCAGAKGKRSALPHAQILMHQPSGGAQGQATDISIHLRHTIELKKGLAERISFHTGQPVEKIEADSDRDRWFTAQEALEYGFIDSVIERSTAQQG